MSLTLVRPSVCLPVTLLLQCASFLFVGRIEPFLGRQFSMWHSTKLFSSIFDLGPLTPKIYSPKFAVAQNRLSVVLYDRYTGDVWAYYGVFGDGRFNGTMQNVVGPTLVAMAMTLGLGAEI